MKLWRRKQDRSSSLLQASDVKSNRGDNNSSSSTDAAAITRFHNPIFQTGKCGGVAVGWDMDPGNDKTLAKELNDIDIDLDIEKYEKSPRRDLRNITQYNISQQRSSKVKDINVELSRSRIPPDADGMLV